MPNPIREYEKPAFTLGEDWDTVAPELRDKAAEYAPFARVHYNEQGVISNVTFDQAAFDKAEAQWDAAEITRYEAELAAEQAAADAPLWEPLEAVTDPLTARVEDIEAALIELAEIVTGG